MSQTVNFLGLDLGAESGRAMLGQFDGQRLTLSECHRFPNITLTLPSGLHWDILNLWREMKVGLGKGIAVSQGHLASVGLDTWGVDFALLDRHDELLGLPHHYRDSRTEGLLDDAFQIVPQKEIFAQTGIQFMHINTLFQLLALRKAQSPLLDIAETLLMIPDLFNFWLTGRKVSEFSVATTSQCYNPRTARWATTLLAKFDLPSRIFPDIVPTCTELGPLLPPLAEEVGGAALRVIAPACHDTGAAVAAVPAQGQNFVYISSGTWSLMGLELPEPIINEQSLAANLTNEGGVHRTFRLLKNIMGLWLVQECRRTWARAGEDLSYADLTALAEQGVPFRTIIDPDYEGFLAPGDMPSRIRAYSQQTGQPVPDSKGAMLRCIFESLALKYRYLLEQLEALKGTALESINIVGGGAQNALLCQLTADACQRPVSAGPVEATAIGNIVTQAIALGHLSNLSEARDLIRHSFAGQTFEPRSDGSWEGAYERLLKMMG